VPLHDDADCGADVLSGVQGLVEVFDLVGVAEQHAGVGSEQLRELEGGPIERMTGAGVQVEPGLSPLLWMSWIAACAPTPRSAACGP
jgi:hypothetical protein